MKKEESPIEKRSGNLWFYMIGAKKIVGEGSVCIFRTGDGFRIKVAVNLNH